MKAPQGYPNHPQHRSLTRRHLLTHTTLCDGLTLHPWRSRLLKLFMAGLLFSSASLCQAELQALVFKRIIDGSGGHYPSPIITVEQDRIVDVGLACADLPAGVKLRDLSAYTAIPGLIDAHTHIAFAWDGKLGQSPWQFLGATPAATQLFYAQDNALKTLQSGVTTIRDLSASDYLNIQIGRLTASGAMKGPRVFSAGYGLHPTSQASRPGFIYPKGGRVDGTVEMMRAVREQIAAGAQWIKLFGSTGSADDTSSIQTFTYAEIKAAVDLSHQMGKRVAFHSYGANAARDAVRAGVDSIEHADDLDRETLKQMAKQNIVYVPTIDHNRYYIDNKTLFGYNADVVQSLQDFIQRNLDTTRRAHRLGVTIAMGSDAVFSMFGENTRELEWFVKAGMTPAEALATATVNGARLLGQETTLGQLKPGFYADIVAIEGDPLKDIRALVKGVHWVMKAGTVLVDQTPEHKNGPTIKEHQCADYMQ